VKNKPPYAIESVDNALRLAQLLLLDGTLSVTEAARHLAVSPSTAHRLLAMLVYRDFAEQGRDRLYRPGPALRSSGAAEAPLALLRARASYMRHSDRERHRPARQITMRSCWRRGRRSVT
jgi:IclR family acetate operon transcriptional repressor